MDNELIEGATLETTYTITAKNVGELDYTNKDYYLFGNKDENYIVKTSVAQLLDYVDGRVQIVDESKNWNDVSSDQDYANKWFISKKDDTSYTGSYMYQWLNEDFLDTLYNYKNINSYSVL